MEGCITTKCKIGLSFGIIILVVLSAVTPMSLGHDIKVPEVKRQKPINSSYDNPPEEEWNKTFGGLDRDIGYSVKQTNDGGYIVGGLTASFRSGFPDAWLIKTDENGTEEWNQSYGGLNLEECKSLLITPDGGYIIFCKYTDVETFESDLLLIKTDEFGREEWNKTLGGTGGEDARYIGNTNDAGYILIGFTSSYGAGDTDAWLIKLDENFNEEWNKTYGGSICDSGKYVEQTSDNGYIIAGSTSSFSSSGVDLWIIKTDENGREHWNVSFGGIHDDSGYSVHQVSDGGYIVSGTTTSFGHGECDVWFLRLDEDGELKINKTIGSYDAEWGLSGQLTTDGGYIIAGKTESYGGGSSDVWLVKTDIEGNLQWHKPIGGKYWEIGHYVQQTNDDGYIITGYKNTNKISGPDLWLIKIAHESQPPDAPTIDGPISGKTGVSYPYTFTSNDSDGDDVSYYISWGDGNVVNWTEFQASGPPGYTESHSWDIQNTYIILAKAIDIHGIRSDWGTLTVTMPRDKATNNMLFWKFIERFPLLERFLISIQWGRI